MQCSFLLFRSGTHHLLRNERFFERVVLSAQQATPLLRARSVRCQRSSSGTGEAILRRNMLGLLEISMLSAVRERAPTPYGWHDLLHTITTWAVKTYPTKVVSEMLGHSNVRTTLDVYGSRSAEDFEAPLAEMAGKLVPVVA